MSTTNEIKESVKKAEYPAPKNHQEREAKSKVPFSTKKLSFLAGMQELSGVRALLLWGEDRLPGTAIETDPFFHFVRCERFGYTVYVPVMDKGCAA